jgi:bacterioferritin
MEDEQMHARNSNIVYSQSLKGPEFMTVADELEQHAGEELQHVIKIAKQIDYLGGAPTARAEPVKLTADNQEMLRADLESENETIRNYLERVKQCELLSEYATAETIREILIDEQDHQIALATVLGISVTRVGMEGKGQ